MRSLQIRQRQSDCHPDKNHRHAQSGRPFGSQLTAKAQFRISFYETDTAGHSAQLAWEDLHLGLILPPRARRQRSGHLAQRRPKQSQSRGSDDWERLWADTGRGPEQRAASGVLAGNADPLVDSR